MRHPVDPRYTSPGYVGPPRRERFQLTSSLSPGGSVTAYIRKWNGSALVTDSTYTYTLYDTLNTFSGASGDNCLAQYWPDSSRWEIEQKVC